MRFFTRRDCSMLALAVVFGLVVLVYGGTHALTTAVNAEPDECNATYFDIEDICFNEDRTAYYSNQPTIDITLRNAEMDINGFRINLFANTGIEPVILFKTVKSGALSILSTPYDPEIMGKLRRIEIEPILNLNQNIHYCSLNHGVIYEGEIPTC